MRLPSRAPNDPRPDPSPVTSEARPEVALKLKRRVSKIVNFMREAHHQFVLVALFEFVLNRKGAEVLCAVPQLVLASDTNLCHKPFASHGTLRSIPCSTFSRSVTASFSAHLSSPSQKGRAATASTARQRSGQLELRRMPVVRSATSAQTARELSRPAGANDPTALPHGRKGEKHILLPLGLKSARAADARTAADASAATMDACTVHRPRIMPLVVQLAHQLECCREEMMTRRRREQLLERKIVQLESSIEQMNHARDAALKRTARLREVYDGRIAEQEERIGELQSEKEAASERALALQEAVFSLSSSSAEMSTEICATQGEYFHQTYQTQQALLEKEAMLEELTLKTLEILNERDKDQQQYTVIMAKYKKEVEHARAALGRVNSMRRQPSSKSGMLNVFGAMPSIKPDQDVQHQLWTEGQPNQLVNRPRGTPSTIPPVVEQLWAGGAPVQKLKAAVRVETHSHLLAYLHSQLALKLKVDAEVEAKAKIGHNSVTVDQVCSSLRARSDARQWPCLERRLSVLSRLRICNFSCAGRLRSTMCTRQSPRRRTRELLQHCTRNLLNSR